MYNLAECLVNKPLENMDLDVNSSILESAEIPTLSTTELKAEAEIEAKSQIEPQTENQKRAEIEPDTQNQPQPECELPKKSLPSEAEIGLDINLEKIEQVDTIFDGNLEAVHNLIDIENELSKQMTDTEDRVTGNCSKIGGKTHFQGPKKHFSELLVELQQKNVKDKQIKQNTGHVTPPGSEKVISEGDVNHESKKNDSNDVRDKQTEQVTDNVTSPGSPKITKKENETFEQNKKHASNDNNFSDINYKQMTDHVTYSWTPNYERLKVHNPSENYSNDMKNKHSKEGTDNVTYSRTPNYERLKVNNCQNANIERNKKNKPNENNLGDTKNKQSKNVNDSVTSLGTQKVSVKENVTTDEQKIYEDIDDVSYLNDNVSCEECKKTFGSVYLLKLHNDNFHVQSTLDHSLSEVISEVISSATNSTRKRHCHRVYKK